MQAIIPVWDLVSRALEGNSGHLAPKELLPEGDGQVGLQSQSDVFSAPCMEMANLERSVFKHLRRTKF